ncbi:MAG TPA: hypothetical protein VEH50_15015, partial [Methylomirabilota bacterium]|nr:hypothetical protein [Methylomirabilota bacterium]
MPHRGIATLAAALMLSFLYLTHLETEFFLLHFYQSLIYLVIILMLFYFEEQYAYMLGMLAPAVWLLMTYATGLLGGAARQVGHLLREQRPTNSISLMAAVIAVLSVVMIVGCAYRWKREFAGLHKFGKTFVIGLIVVVLYYGILITVFWHMFP